eukprot:946590-Prorocentrum_minimum.AAC.1
MDPPTPRASHKCAKNRIKFATICDKIARRCHPSAQAYSHSHRAKWQASASLLLALKVLLAL